MLSGSESKPGKKALVSESAWLAPGVLQGGPGEQPVGPSGVALKIISM